MSNCKRKAKELEKITTGYDKWRQKDKTLMSPEVKLRNEVEKSPEKHRWGDYKQIFRTYYRSLIIVLFHRLFIQTVCFSSHSCGQLARETALCGSESLQSDRTLLFTAFKRVGLCGWVCVNVWGGVHHWAGTTPRFHYSIIARYITKALFLISFLPFFLFSFSIWQNLFLASVQIYLLHLTWLPCNLRLRRNEHHILCRPHTLVCNTFQSSKSAYSYSVVLRNYIRPQSQRERSYEEDAS